MKGDFSRLRFNPSRHYTSVVQQQGRVALDADTNEQCAIHEHIRDTEAADIIGPFGGPAGNEGFAIAMSGNTLQIGAGHYYVNGILCENEASLGYTSQPYLINPSLTDAQLLAEVKSGVASAIRIWLEVWQRLVTALDDTCLREAALGQADTTARVQTVWRVFAEPVLTTKTQAGATTPTTTLSTRVGAEISRLQATGITSVGATQDCCTQMYQPSLKPPAGKMMAQTTGGSSDCSCEPTPAAGYRGLENQLYRVEIHHGGDEKTATFKWSRENGSVVAALANFSGSHVFVDSLGPDANLGFAAAQWVELSDDTDQFGPIPNQSGGLVQIKSVTPEQLSLTMTIPVVGVDTTKNARVRRWEQSGVSAGPSGIPLFAQTWVNLENGIQVQFAPGQYQAGDHWLIPARTASGQIDWPPCDSDGALAQPPHRTPVYRAPLACIQFDPAARQLRVDDCRRSFPALTDLAPSAVGPALHVVALNWPNDDILTFDQLLANGLQITLDQPATSQIDSGKFQVTWEVPVVSNTEPRAVSSGLTPIVLRAAMPIDGQVTVNGAMISWVIPFATGRDAQSIHLLAILELNALLLQGTSYASFARMRVRLMGDMIFGGAAGSQVFLDGQCSGRPGLRSDGVTPRTDLLLPSSNNQKSSDFESWCYLAPFVTIVNLTIQPNAILFAGGQPAQPQATVTLNYPPIVDTKISLSVITPPGVLAVVSVPSQVTVPKGKTTATFPISAGNTRITSPAIFGIVASLPTAIGSLFPQQANLTITGTQVIL